MTPQESKAFRNYLLSLPTAQRFRAQLEFANSNDPVKFARAALLRRAGGVEGA